MKTRIEKLLELAEQETMKCPICKGQGLVLISLANPLRDAGIGGTEKVCGSCSGAGVVEKFPIVDFKV